VTDFGGVLGPLLTFVSSAEGVALVFLFLLAAGVSLLWRPGRWILLGLALFVSCLGTYLYLRPWDVLAFPLQTMKMQSRPLTTALLFCTAIALFRFWKGRHLWRPLPALTAFFIFQLIFAVRLINSPAETKGYFALAVFSLTFLALGVGLPCAIADGRDVRWAVRSVAIAAGFFSLATVYQLVVQPSVAVWGGRLMSVTGNPNFVGVLLAVTLPSCLYLFFTANKRSSEWYLSLAATTLSLVFLIWAASRTGILMAIIGVAILLRHRMRRALGGTLIVAALAAASLFVYSEATTRVGRLVSDPNNREHSWSILTQQFLDSPLIGQGGEAGASESSYLWIAAQTGLVGLWLVAVSVVLFFAAFRKARRRRGMSDPNRFLLDLVEGTTVALLVGAAFEGFLLAVYGIPMMVLYIQGSILSHLVYSETAALNCAGNRVGARLGPRTNAA